MTEQIGLMKKKPVEQVNNLLVRNKKLAEVFNYQEKNIL